MKPQDSRMANYAYCNYKQNIKELLQKNWNKVHAIVKTPYRNKPQRKTAAYSKAIKKNKSHFRLKTAKINAK